MECSEKATSQRLKTPLTTQQMVRDMAKEIQVLRGTVSNGSVSGESNKSGSVDLLLFIDDRVISGFDPAKDNQSINDRLRK